MIWWNVFKANCITQLIWKGWLLYKFVNWQTTQEGQRIATKSNKKESQNMFNERESVTDRSLFRTHITCPTKVVLLGVLSSSLPDSSITSRSWLGNCPQSNFTLDSTLFCRGRVCTFDRMAASFLANTAGRVTSDGFCTLRMTAAAVGPVPCIFSSKGWDSMSSIERLYVMYAFVSLSATSWRFLTCSSVTMAFPAPNRRRSSRSEVRSIRIDCIALIDFSSTSPTLYSLIGQSSGWTAAKPVDCAPWNEDGSVLLDELLLLMVPWWGLAEESSVGGVLTSLATTSPVGIRS